MENLWAWVALVVLLGTIMCLVLFPIAWILHLFVIFGAAEKPPNDSVTPNDPVAKNTNKSRKSPIGKGSTGAKGLAGHIGNPPKNVVRPLHPLVLPKVKNKRKTKSDRKVRRSHE